MKLSGLTQQAVTVLPLSLLSATLVLCVGCSPTFEQRIGSIGAHRDSYDLAGERVSVRMLTTEEFAQESARLGVENTNAFIDSETESFLSAAGVFSDLIDMGFKWVQGQIDKEQARYQQQFSGSTYATRFWQGAGPRFKGLLVTRDTARDAEVENGRTVDKGPAFELLCAITPVEHGTFLVVRPLYVKTARAKAKIAAASNVVKTEINIEQHSEWIDSDGNLQDKKLAVVDWTESGLLGTAYRYNLNQPPNVPAAERVHNKDVGVLVTPPISAIPASSGDGGRDAAARPGKGGLIQLLVTVTESDATDTANVIKAVSKFVQDETPKLESQLKQKQSKAKKSGSASPATVPSTSPAGGET